MKRLYPDRPVVGVGAILMCKDKILLEKRRNDPGRGKWSIPGGVVELGESLEQTAIREVKEETNLTVDRPELIDVVDDAESDENGRIKYHFVIVDYYLKLVGGTLKAGSDAAELRWVAFDEVKKYDLTKTFREFFIRNKDRLRMLSSGS